MSYPIVEPYTSDGSQAIVTSDDLISQTSTSLSGLSILSANGAGDLCGSFPSPVSVCRC